MSAIIEIVEITLRILKNSSDDLALHFDNIYFAFSKLTNFYALPFVLTIFLLALLTACAVLICIFSLHILLRFLLRKKGRVFISYYHKDEELATEVSERLIDSGLLTVKLPFIKEVDHDDLLDSIRHEILDCDVFLCIPGGNPSFVENEVSMAFSLDKPQVFLVSTERPARLPNTAKKGFPLFNLGLSRQESFRTIALLCSYISHDKNATLRFYGLLFNYVGSCIALVAVVLASSIAAGTLIAKSELAFCNIGQIYQLQCPIFLSYFGLIVGAVLAPWFLFILVNQIFRARAIKSLSKRRFSTIFLPEHLDYSLSRDRLRSVLFLPELPAQHDSAEA